VGTVLCKYILLNNATNYEYHTVALCEPSQEPQIDQ